VAAQQRVSEPQAAREREPRREQKSGLRAQRFEQPEQLGQPERELQAASQPRQRLEPVAERDVEELRVELMARLAHRPDAKRQAHPAQQGAEAALPAQADWEQAAEHQPGGGGRLSQLLLALPFLSWQRLRRRLLLPPGR
jgi:hypothetical protein